MKIMTKNKLIRFLKCFLFVSVVIFASTFLQFYWSMGQFSERMSSSCMECWFVEDAFYMSILTGVFLAIIFNSLVFIKNKFVQIGIQFLFLISIWYFWDYTIFVERESSWSTYLFNEEIYYVTSLSVLPILVLSLATVFFINYKSFYQ